MVASVSCGEATKRYLSLDYLSDFNFILFIGFIHDAGCLFLSVSVFGYLLEVGFLYQKVKVMIVADYPASALFREGHQMFLFNATNKDLNYTIIASPDLCLGYD